MAPAEVAASTSDPTAGLLQVLTGGRPARWKSALSYSVVGVGLTVKAYKRWKAWTVERSFSVTVCDLDDIYTDVQRWLLDRIPEQERRGLMASSHKGKYHRDGADVMPMESGGGKRQRPERRVRLTYDGTKPQDVMIDGHRIKVLSEKRTYGDADKGNYGDPAKVTFTAPDRAGRDAAVGFLQEVATKFEQDRSDNAADIWIGTRWGDWTRVREIPPRPLESVVLAGDLLDRLVNDLDQFLADEATYVRLGLPYHRGILLHGPPGVGKSSVAKVLAGHHGLDIYCLPLSSMKEDTDIGRMLAQVGPRSMLLMEDIDIVHAAKSRDDSGPGISLSGLLNALDGVATPHGLITVMTTNDLAVLDPALVRPGRADQTVLIDYLDDEQLGRLVCSIYGHAWQMDGMIPWLDGRRLSPAAVIEAIKPHLADPEAGFRAVTALVQNTSMADA